LIYNFEIEPRRKKKEKDRLITKKGLLFLCLTDFSKQWYRILKKELKFNFGEGIPGEERKLGDLQVQ